MVEVPKELQKFKIKQVCTGQQARTPDFIVQPILEDVLTEMVIDELGEEKARMLAKMHTERILKGVLV